MIVSDSKKFIFVHVPKTAGKSVSAALMPYADKKAANPLHIHETISEFYQRTRKAGHRPPLPLMRRRSHDDSARYADYFSFAFVRNPWARAVSSFSYLQKIDLPEAKNLDFDRFMHDLESGAHYLQSIFIPKQQIDFMTDYRGEIVLDRVCRYENLQQDFAEVCERIGVKPDLEWRNPSQHRPYVDYFDDAKRAVIARIYARDIEAFGYRFDDALS